MTPHKGTVVPSDASVWQYLGLLCAFKGEMNGQKSPPLLMLLPRICDDANVVFDINSEPKSW